MSKEQIVAELAKMKEAFLYSLQAMRTVNGMVEAELALLVPEIRAKFESVGRGLRGLRTAHAGDNQTPIVFFDPEGDAPFGATPEEKEVIAWLDKTVKEKTGVGARIELGRVATAGKG
jgi:hypothetical protein